MNVEEFLEKIESAKIIKDQVTREWVYRELAIPASFYTKFENIVKKAENKASKMLAKRTSHAVEFCQKNLEKNNVIETELDEYYGVAGVYRRANTEIVRERIRAATLKAIIKAIRDIGFVVDTKRNIKIDRERDVVKMAAKKPSGQLAEFEIQLNGKFMYHFDGYEGGTCTNDIEPFIKVLDEIYGVHIVSQKVHHDEPLKESKQRRYFNDTNRDSQRLD